MTASRDSVPSPPPTPWAFVVLLGGATAMGALAIDMNLPALPAIGEALRADPSATQATMAAFLAGQAVGQVFYGPASDRFGRRPPMLIGVVIFAAASAACALATSVEQLLLARFVQALGACAGGVVARAVVRDRFDHTETARMLSLMGLIMGLAPILAPLLGALLLGLGDWTLIFWFMAAFGVVLSVSTFLWLKESRSEATALQARQENPLQAYVALLRNRRLMGYVLAGSLNGATLFTYISSSPSLVMQVYGFSPAIFPLIFAANSVGLIGAGQLNRMALRRRTPDYVLARAILVTLALGVALAVAAGTGFGGYRSVLPLLFLMLASYSFVQANTMAGALNCDPLRVGSISAFFGAASFGIGALATTLGAQLYDGTARPMAFVMVAALAGSATALFGLALPKARPA